RSFFPGMLALLLFLSYYGTREWIAFGRVDIPALAFAVCGMAACSNKHRIVGVTLGTLMLCLAFFTKQTQIIAPAAIFLGLWWQGERKLAVGFAGALGILCGSLLYYGTLITQGEFWLHLVDYNRNAMNWNAFLGFLLNTELDFAWGAYVLLILGWGIAYLLRKIRGKIPREIDPAKHRPRSRALPILVWYSILSLLFTVTSAKVGSAVNYYLEFHLAVSLLVALVLGLLMKELPHREKMWHRSAIWTANISLIVALGAYGISQYLPREKLGGAAIRQIVFTPIPQRTSHFDYVYAQVAQASDPVLSDDPTFQVFSGQRAIFQPFIMSQLAAERQWSPELLINRIYQRDFELIILTQPIRRVNDANELIPEYAPVQGWAPQIIAAIASSYKFHEQAGRFHLYIRPDEERFQRGLQSAGNSSQVREKPTS
ncbi:MAG: hypothetical protein SFY68_07770, partial [Candidatus Sumerlaeia bacterium]|nr:hypothetical protein [Candidatus Sumerlaeia bacterium]